MQVPAMDPRHVTSMQMNFNRESTEDGEYGARSSSFSGLGQMTMKERDAMKNYHKSQLDYNQMQVNDVRGSEYVLAQRDE